MKRIVRALIVFSGVIACAVTIGFVLFTVHVTKNGGGTAANADAIVVLTGADSRIEEGAKLLAEGRGRRMLISGVNRQTTKQDVLKMTGLTEARFDCCVDLGYTAQNTVGNADETRAWAKARGFSSLIIVTSNYHMPRSIAELSLELQGTRLLPHPVVSKSFPRSAWWLYPRTARILVAEYLKFLPAAAQLAVFQLARSTDGDDAIAETPPNQRPAS